MGSFDVRRFGTTLGREWATVLGSWVVVLLGLSIWQTLFTSVAERQREMLRRQNPGISDERLREAVPGAADGPIDFFVDAATFQWGTSLELREPVVEVVGRSLPVTLGFLIPVAVFATLGVIVACIVVGHLADPADRWPAALGGVAGLFVPLLGLSTVLVLAYVVGYPARFTGIRGGSNVVPLVFAAAVVAIPIVADAVRRTHRAVGRRPNSGVAKLLFATVGSASGLTTTLWASYVLSTTIIVEAVFRSRGIGYLFHEGLANDDFFLVLGTGLTFVLLVLVAEAIASVAVAVQEALWPATSAGQRRDGTAVTSLLENRAVLGALGLGVVAAIVGLVGALAFSPQRVRPVRDGVELSLGPGQVLGTMWSMVAALAIAVIVAVVLGAVAGVLSGYLRATRGRQGGVVAWLIRLPGEAALSVPLAVIIGFAVVGWSTTGSTDSFLLFSIAAGVVLAGAVVRAVDAATRRRIGADGETGSLAIGAAADALVRVEYLLVGVVFVLGELVFLGWFPPGIAPAFRRLDEGLSQSVLVSSPAQMLLLVIQAGVAVTVVLVAVYLLVAGCHRTTLPSREDDV